MSFKKNISTAYAGGLLGGLVNTVLAFVVVNFGIASLINVHLPHFTSHSMFLSMLYQQMVWGGLWGLLFATPFMSARWFWRGLIIGTLPSLVTLFFIMPHSGHGLLGSDFGALTFVVVLILNWVWGLVASAWYAA